MKQFLEELQSIYTLYKPLWSEWARKRNNGLTPDDLYILSVHIQNNFKINVEDEMMFYNKVLITKALVQKLKNNYPKFKKWTIQKFVNSLLYKAVLMKPISFGREPIEKLPIDSELKRLLLTFDVPTVYQIIKMSERKYFLNKLFIDKVHACQVILSREEKRHLKHKMEVIREK